MKKLLIIGAIALVVIGCVLAAGCTSNTSTTTTTEDFAVGTWTLPNGTTVVFGNDFKGIMMTGDKTFNFTWKKTADGKYQVDREDGAQVLWTLDNVKGTMTNADGAVLSKQTSDISGRMRDWCEDLSDINSKTTRISLNANANLGYVAKSLNGVGYIKQGRNFMTDIVNPEYYSSDPTVSFTITGYYTEPIGGEKLFDKYGLIENENLPPYTSDGLWVYDGERLTLYTHWVSFAKLDEGFTGASAHF